jgi:uncharacterized damage-inducible protein DinB
MPTAERIRGLYPPGGYANAIGVHLAALDRGLEEVKARARKVPAGKLGTKLAPDVRSPMELVLHVGEVEARWIHEGVGGKPAAPPPAATTLEEAFARLDDVRRTSAAILRTLVEADLDRLRAVPGFEGKTTVRRLLVDLLQHQAHHRGQLGMLARLLAR